MSKPSFSISPLRRAARSCSRNACAFFLRPAGSLRLVRERLHERMLGAEQHECRTVDRVDAGGEHLDDGLRVAFERELDARALRPPDPVLLHRQNFFGPLGQRAGGVQQFIGVRSDAEEPLLEIAGLDGRVAAPALAVHDLFVGEDRVVHRAPVHRRLAAIGEALLEHADEEPLVPLVVLGVAGRELALPGIADAEALELPLHVRDVAAGRDLGMNAVLDRGVLRWQTECIPPERVQHVVTAHPLHARQRVADAVVADVPHVGMAGGIREHLEAVELRLRAIDLNLECACGRPFLLPLPIEFLWMVVGH